MIARLDNPFAMGKLAKSASVPKTQYTAPQPVLRFQSMFDPSLDDVPFSKQDKPTGLSYFRRQARPVPQGLPLQRDTWESSGRQVATPSEWPQ